MSTHRAGKANPDSAVSPDAPAQGGLIELSTQSVRPHERVDYWRELVCRRFADVELSSRLGTDFQGELRGRTWGETGISFAKAKAQAATRMRHQAREAYEDCYFAVVLLAGSELVEQGGRRAALRPGDITIYDAQSAHRVIFPEDFQKVIMQIPRTMLRDRFDGIEQCTALTIPHANRAGAMAGTFLQSFARQARGLSEPELAAYTELSLELLSIAVASVNPADVPPVRNQAQSLHRIKRFVEEHLGDHALDSIGVARGTGLSVRYINQLFEREDTSLMRYVWMRRLERCRSDVLGCARSELRVYDIALRWGFSTPSHFSRVFKLRFGSSPREYWQRHQLSRGS